jgi:hypothetical protein
MSAIADETLALNVAEATMHDWLAAVLLAKHEPMPAAAPRVQPQVAVRMVEFPRPAVRRSAARAVDVNRSVPEGVAGARPVYWLSLAAALALILVF